uniref:Uncharacterized protein n=1 Tax=Anopheles coluzzii TaxID=1518534 RepID=A0A8W7Q2T2_ANOCL
MPGRPRKDEGYDAADWISSRHRKGKDHDADDDDDDDDVDPDLANFVFLPRSARLTDLPDTALIVLARWCGVSRKSLRYLVPASCYGGLRWDDDTGRPRFSRTRRARIARPRGPRAGKVILPRRWTRFQLAIVGTVQAAAGRPRIVNGHAKRNNGLSTVICFPMAGWNIPARAHECVPGAAEAPDTLPRSGRPKTGQAASGPVSGPGSDQPRCCPSVRKIHLRHSVERMWVKENTCKRAVTLAGRRAQLHDEIHGTGPNGAPQQ